MSILGAMKTGVSGLQANAASVANISENIANANTDGFRRSFSQMVTTTTTNPSSMSGVIARDRIDMGTPGSMRPTDSATDLALEGGGFFVVSQRPDEPLASNYMLTRAGSFTPDENGNLKNAAGFYLAGFPTDQNGQTGGIDRTSFGDLSTVNVLERSIQGAPTTTIALSGNLPAQESGLATPGAPFISSAEYFNPLGGAERLELRWLPSMNKNEWTLEISGPDPNQPPYGWVTATFEDSGPNAGSPLTYQGMPNGGGANFAFNDATGQATLTIDNGNTPQVITLDLGAPGEFDGMTQFAGDYTPPQIDRDGSEAGNLARVEIENDGTVFGFFDNGQRMSLFSLPVANVSNPEGLVAGNGNAYKLSRASGAMTLGIAGGGGTASIYAGALEGSNVDIAEELTDLIATQRAYSTNAKVVTTADEMLDETTRIKR
ncbi:flagellar hook protein FlgE, putative [Oceanicola granulosus HTCC2516]|uniref:Flagellar hook protein FlgE n=1 Tax=Oceanicola granulosus (strain ATCC BAA-861 / DSM 15982 / KCTC 12143 / HTCC2516) TaxID=314256 RepID=Q2CGG5_OCEGH|nr:flagellar hook protein FlgE [Oceanicola granulosus]EAR51753.1 flagellar hook protein FlgE, putative [Oceanicola granulosus HTCC2516]